MTGPASYCDGCEMPVHPALRQCRFCGYSAAHPPLGTPSAQSSAEIHIPVIPDGPVRPPPGIEGFDTRRWRNIFLVLMLAGGFWLWTRPTVEPGENLSRNERCRRTCEVARVKAPGDPGFMSACLSECLAPPSAPRTVAAR